MGFFTAKAFWCLKVRVCQWFLGFVVFRDFSVCLFYGLGFLGFRMFRVFRAGGFRSSRVWGF